MRILHCIPVLDGGGAERQLCYLAAGLTARGHEVDVALLRDGDLDPLLMSSGATAHRLGERHAFSPLLPAALGRLILRRKIDVVQTWLRRMDLAGGLAALATRRPWIYSERTIWQAGGMRQELRRRLIAHSAAAVANSRGAIEELQKILRGPEMHVVPNALPIDEIDAAPRAKRAAIGIPEEAELLLFVGRFSTEKNIDLLLAVARALLARRPRAHLLCLGKGPRLDEFRRALAGDAIGKRVHTPGFRDDVWSILKSADALLSTSNWEGRPNAVLEAMACRCPLVLSDIPAHREICGDEDARFYSAGSIPGSVAAIENVFDDRDAATARATRAATRVRELSFVEIARRYEAIYQRVLAP